VQVLSGKVVPVIKHNAMKTFWGWR